MTTIYMARHGETALNQKKVYYGWTDEPLSPEGEEQCQQLNRKLAQIHFDAVITSPLQRAKSSAEIIIGRQENILIYDELKELNFGNWEGLHYSDIAENHQAEWNAWCKDWINFCIPAGESFQSFYNRVSHCLTQLLAGYHNKAILIVAHEGTLKVISLLLLEFQVTDYWKFTFEFGAYSVVDVQEDGAAIIKKINCK